MKRRVLYLVAWILFITAHSAWAVPAFVQNVTTATATQTANSLTITTGIAVAKGNHLMVSAMRSIATDTIASCTDSASPANIYTVDVGGLNFNTSDAYGVCSGYMATALTSTDTVTITWTAASAFNYFAGQLTEYSGLATSSWTDQSASAQAFHTQAQGVDSGATGTTTQASELIFGAMILDSNTETFSAGTNFNMRAQFGFAGPVVLMGVEDQVVSSTSTYSCTGSWVVGNHQEGAVCVTYKAGGAAASVPTRTLIGVGQ